jgi:anti-sigma regulatory factor (Ser/Thr protein kinase)
MIVCMLRLDADESVSRPVADFVVSLAQQAGLTTRQAYRLRLAVDEVITNVALHGYGEDGWGVIDLEGGMDVERIWVQIEDDAPAFDPRSYDPTPRLAAGPIRRDACEPGGLGLFLALSNVDEFAYDRIRGRNRTTLIIRRSAAGVGSGDMKGGTNARDAGTGRR